jgi:hypothetical protein
MDAVGYYFTIGRLLGGCWEAVGRFFGGCREEVGRVDVKGGRRKKRKRDGGGRRGVGRWRGMVSFFLII